MKRFLIIFGICFASVIVFFGGYLGIKYLKGDFNPEVILPENITFEQSEYYLEDGQNATMLITTTTENVTETKVSLVLSKNCKETLDKTHWTDGIIVIPKIAYIGEPFSVTLVKDDVYSSELPDDSALTNWITGGVSTIIATSQNNLIRPASTTAYVDVPVYKTEMVIYNGEVKNTTFDQTFKLAEFSSLTSLASDGTSVSNISAGEKFYVGLKYYPSASAIKYSKVSSTNMLVEYKAQILEKLENLQLTSLITELEALFEAQDASGSAMVDFNTIITAYNKIVENSGNGDLNDYIANLTEKYYKNLKYFNITEKSVGTDNKVVLNGRVKGTNIYEYVATQDLGNVDFYTYSFKKSGTEDVTFAIMEDGDDVLQVLESSFTTGDVIKNTFSLNIVDVEVDTMELTGSISNFGENKIHTIYASKYGVNTSAESYLNIKLSNSNIPDVNLQNSIVNVGIRFEVKQGTNWVDASEIIKFKNQQNYTRVTYNEKTYYLPYGSANYWEVYANEYVDGVFRVVVRYLLESAQEAGTYNSIVEIAENALPQFSLFMIEENMVSWLNTEKQTLKVINLTGVLNSSGEAVAITTNQEYNLAQNVNREVLNQNTYTTIKYFIYADDTTYKLSEYFETENTEAVEYIFNDGSVKQLYELSSSILKLKDVTKVPQTSVKAIFVTVKTDIYGTPSIASGKYEVVKYSAVKDNLLEKLSSVEFVFESSLKTLSGSIKIVDTNNAGVIQGKLLVAQNGENILQVEINCNTEDEAIFEEAINNGEITVVAKVSQNSASNFITLNNGILTTNKITYDVSTTSVSDDTEVSMYIVYSIAGNSYMFPVTFTYIDVDTKQETTISRLTIIENINSSAKFVVLDNSGEEIDLTTVEYIEVTTEYQTTITQVYTVYFKDGSQTPLKIADTNLFENGTLKVAVKNFLNKNGTDAWVLSSSNAQVATINIEDKKTINFVGNGDVVISLTLEGNADVQDTLTFRISNDGYVSAYATYDNDGNKISTFSSSDPYESKTIILSVNGDGGVVNLQDTTQTDISLNTSLFAMWYSLGDGEDNKKLSFKIKVADDESKEVFNSIVIDSQKLAEENYYLGASFTPRKTLGRTVVLHLIYECNELNNISQKITLNILWTTSVTKFNVYDQADNKLTETKTGSFEYDIYAGYGYKFETEISNNRTANYYVLNDKSEVEEITASSSIVKLVGGLFYFDDVSGKKTYQIYVSDVASGIEIGDLQHTIVFNVSSNIKAVESVVNAGYRYSIGLNTNGRASINFTDLFERKIGTKAFDAEFKIVTASTGVTLSATGLDIAFSGLNLIVNSTDVRVTLSYGGYTLNEIIITVTPYDYEMVSADRIVKYNNEKAIVLVVGDAVTGSLPDIIASQINGVVTIDNETAFAEYIAENKITATANNLFTNTNCYAIVKDNAGNQTKYKLIVSQLAYPFVNFNFAGSYTAKDLDIYKLFVTLGKEDLNAYYGEFGAYVGSEYFGGDEILLVKEVAGDNAIFNFVNSANISFGMSLVESGEASDYASIDGVTLTTYEVGKEYISLHIILRYKNGSYTYNIPVILKVKQSQLLKVTYPYDETVVENISGYGTDEYDSQKMVEITTAFSNAVMEYVGFTNGTASVELTNDRFAVYQKVDADYELDTQYNSGYEFSLAKVWVCLNGVWTQILPENMAGYVTVSGNVVTFARGGADAIRAKILVETAEGKAENYYYIQAGQLEVFNLYKHDGNTETTVNYQDTITVNTGAVIAINSTSTADYKYYTKTNADKLKFEVIGGEGLVRESAVNKEIEILRSPNNSLIQIKVFTIYGEIAIINVNINAYYTAELKTEDVFSGTELKIADIVKITDILDADVTAKAVLLESSEIAKENFVIENNSGIYYIKFAHSKTAYTISNFACLVEIDTYTFKVEIKNLQVNAGVTSKLLASEVKVLEKQTESGGQVTLDKSVWDTLFNFNALDKTYGISYRIIYNANVVSASKDANTLVDVGVLTGNSSMDFEFQVILTNVDGSTVIISSFAKMEVEPQYTAVVNYPQGINTSFECEYVQVGATIDFTGKNFNDEKRINLIETTTGNEISYTLKLKEKNGSLIAGFSGNGYKFENEGSFEVDILYNDKLYGRYYVEVVSENPIGVDVSNIDGQTLYAGYGTDSIFNYVDISFDLPSNISLLTHAQQFDIVAKLEDGSYETLITGLYYNSNENTLSYRFAVALEKYNKGVSTTNIYVQYTTNDGTFDLLCKNVSINTRISVTYYGRDVAPAAYENIVGITGASITDLTGGRYSYSLSYTTDIVADKSGADNKITGEFFIECDIALTLNTEDGIDLVLNANEYPDGLSFVELFNLRDLQGKSFWYNHVGLLAGAEAKLSLAYKEVDTEFANPVKIENQTVEKDSSHYTYDFKLKAEGAKNYGSVITLTLTYDVSGVVFTQDIVIKVISDIVVNVLNGDGKATPNSETNPLTLSTTTVKTLVQGSQTTSLNDRYHIWVYSKYDQTQKNVAQTLKYQLYGEGTYAYADLSNSNLIFTYNIPPTFGDKIVTITFKDNFGYTFVYYITLVAENRISNVTVTQDSYFEGASINVYNKNDPNNANLKGIALDLRNESDEAITTEVIIDSVVVRDIAISEIIDVTATSGSHSIALINPQQSFWNYGNGQTVTITLDIFVKSLNGSETCQITRSIAVRKLYELSVKEENTYVRDGVDFEIEHLVSVYDYENSTYLGEPVLDVADAIKVELAISNSYVLTNSFTYTYEKNGSEVNETINLVDLNIKDLMIARLTEDYTSVSSKFKFGTTSTLTLTTEIVDALLEALDITYSSSGYSVEILVKAINKTNKDTATGIVSIHLDKIFDNAGNVTGFKSNDTSNYIYLGKYQTIFDDLTITKADYDFELYIKKNFTFASNVDDLCFAKTGDITFTISDMKQITKIEGSSTPMAQLSEITVLTVAVAQDVKILLYNGSEITPYEVKKGKDDYYLVEDGFVNTEIQLFTGGYVLSGSTYTVAGTGVTPTGIALNGFTSAAVKDAKNIASISMTSGGTATSKLVLSSTLGLSVADSGIKYQEVLAVISVTFKYEKTQVTYTSEEEIRVTLKYTGIDTSKAYIGTATSKLIEVESTNSAVASINDGSAYVVKGSLYFDLAVWAENIMLIPGVGNTALIANYREKDFSFGTNVDNLEFILEAINGTGGTSQANNLVEISSSNQLILKTDFNLTEYYITINVACKYPNSEGADKYSAEPESIGKVYISFKIV